eukprot:TRINITY_DN407_c0_g2_i2.p2 TRINITY_DN407_c0_g2~~TRINITY_DN407_c0_g2_i2.p2  ORF type:complete len:186 (+),score=76.65 TRINITY_DN407_c0_g2_i2:1446-2003(+)
MIARLAEPICSPYVELATAYGMGLQDLEKCVETNMEIFQEDQNFGLIKQVLKSLKKKQIQDLTNTYMTLSLANIAENAGLSSEQEAEQEILDMIANGEIFAKIDQDKGMVAFEEDPETYDSRPVIDQLAAEIIECAELQEKMQAAVDDISLDAKYIQQQLSAENKWGATGEGVEDGPKDGDMFSM